MVVKAYKENRNTSELERILGIPRSTIRSIVKKFDVTGQVENQQGRGRKKVFSDRDKN
jgi:transposase